MVLCPSNANALCVQRTYDFIEVCGWFAARCDLILLLFDPAKLDISDEMKQVCAFLLLRCWIPKACTPFILPLSLQVWHRRGYGLAHKHVVCWHAAGISMCGEGTSVQALYSALTLQCICR